MKLTKTQLKEMVGREIGKQLDEGFGIDENQYYELKKRLEGDFLEIYRLTDRLENALYHENDEDAEDPLDLVEEIKNLAGEHVR